MEKNERIEVWVTKYALTDGIIRMNVKLCEKGMVLKLKGAFSQYYHGEGRDWHRTQFAAIARAEEMRLKEIASLKKEIARLETMQFKIVED